MKKKLLSMALTLCILASALVFMPTTVSAKSTNIQSVGVTQSEAVTWINSQVGKVIDYDGAYGAQCVDLIKYYYAYFGYGDYGTGNACNYTSNKLPPGWIRTNSPQAGDICVWGSSAKLSANYTLTVYGHVGLVTSVSGETINTVEQNLDESGTQPCKTCSRTASYVTCFIRPSFSTPAPIEYKKPEIQSVYINAQTNNSYRVNVVITNNECISSVKVASWSDFANSSDLHWYNCGFNGGATYYVDIPLSDFDSKNQICNDVYLYDIRGNNVGYQRIVTTYGNPTIENTYINYQTKDSYRVNVVITNNESISSVKVAVWSDFENSSDLHWYNCAFNGGATYFADIPLSVFNNKYNLCNDVYLYGVSGQIIGYERIGTIYNKPEILNTYINYQQDESYRVNIVISNNEAISSVKVATWTDFANSSDLKWYDCAFNGGATYYIDISRSEYINKNQFCNDVYLYDLNGDIVGYARIGTDYSIPPTISDIVVSQVSTKGYRISCKVSDDTGIDRVQFKTWTLKNGQDDLICNNGEIVNGVATYYVKASDHNNEMESYITDIYVYDNFGNLAKETRDYISLTNNPILVDSVDYNGNTYKVYNSGKNWTEAKQWCESQGGHLVTIADEKEWNAVKGLLEKYNGVRCWLGAKKINNTWKWVTGETMIFSKWGAGQPDNYSGAEIYLGTYGDKYLYNYDWNDNGDDAYTIGGFVCEFEKTEPTTSSTTETTKEPTTTSSTTVTTVPTTTSSTTVSTTNTTTVSTTEPTTSTTITETNTTKPTIVTTEPTTTTSTETSTTKPVEKKDFVVSTMTMNAVSNNNAESIKEGSTYSAIITPADGYRLNSVNVVMGGKEIPVTVNDQFCTVMISEVTGDISIIAVATKIETSTTQPTTKNNTTEPTTSNTTVTTVTETTEYPTEVSATEPTISSTIATESSTTITETSTVTETDSTSETTVELSTEVTVTTPTSTEESSTTAEMTTEETTVAETEVSIDTSTEITVTEPTTVFETEDTSTEETSSTEVTTETETTVPVVKEYAVSTMMKNVENSNTENKVEEGKTYTAILYPVDGYKLNSILVTMNKETIEVPFTEESCIVNIPNVSGDISVIAVAVKKATVLELAKTSASVYVKGIVQIRPYIENGVGKTTYKSSNTKVAKVDSKGKVTALKAGTAKITVTNNGVKKVFTVTVKNPKLNKTSVTLKKGKNYTLKITGKVGTAKFSTSNKKIATVSKSGKIVAKKKGSATITVKTNGITLKCKVKVK